MSIKVDEIRSKRFKTERNGYNLNEVDDFLDALADQTEDLARENVRLTEEAKALKEQLADLNKTLESRQTEIEQLHAALETEPKAPEQSADVPAVKEEAGLPTFNEPSYFKNLETTLRETLISAQRIADETNDDARKKARRIVTDAEEQAAALEAQSQQKLSEMRADYESIKSKGEEYHRNFSKLVEEQSRLLKDSPLYTVAE